MEDGTATPRPRSGRLRIALLISLALNLLVLGMIAGAILGGGRDRDRAVALRDLGYGPFVAALPAADRRELVRAVAREAGSFRANRAEMRRTFEALLGALRAEPYDPEALRGIVARQADKVAEGQALGSRLLMERIAAMSADERAAYADALEQALRRGAGRDWRRWRD